MTGISSGRADLRSLERRLGGLAPVREIRLVEAAEGLAAVVRPDFAAVRSTGSGNVSTVVRVALLDALRRLGEDRRLTEVIVTQDPIDGVREHAASPLPAGDRIGRIITSLVEQYGGKWALSGGRSLQLDLGLDSIDWVSFLLEVERQCGIALPPAVAASIVTAEELAQACRAAAAEAPGPGLEETRAWLLQAPEACQTLAPRSAGRRLLGWSLVRLNRLLLRRAFGLAVSGLENLPSDGPYILAPNHCSDLDVPAVLASLPDRVVSRLAWGGNRERLFATPARRLLCTLGHVFPVDDRLPLAALATGVALLRSGRPLVWYPEAWRSPDGHLQPLLRGIGVLSAETGAPLVPVRITGTYEAWPRHRRLPRLRPVTVHFAPPLDPSRLLQATTGADPAQRIADGLWLAMEAISG